MCVLTALAAIVFSVWASGLFVGSGKIFGGPFETVAFVFGAFNGSQKLALTVAAFIGAGSAIALLASFAALRTRYSRRLNLAGLLLLCYLAGLVLLVIGGERWAATLEAILRTTSWGMTTRMIGAMTMVHGDDDGLVLPPKMAPAQVVIMPIYRNDEEKSQVLPYCVALERELMAQTYAGEPLRVRMDNRDIRGGDKKWQWVKRGVPVRIEIGPRDVSSGKVFYGRRDIAGKLEPPPRAVEPIHRRLLATHAVHPRPARDSG